MCFNTEKSIISSRVPFLPNGCLSIKVDTLEEYIFDV